MNHESILVIVGFRAIDGDQTVDRVERENFVDLESQRLRCDRDRCWCYRTFGRSYLAPNLVGNIGNIIRIVEDRIPETPPRPPPETPTHLYIALDAGKRYTILEPKIRIGGLLALVPFVDRTLAGFLRFGGHLIPAPPRRFWPLFLEAVRVRIVIVLRPLGGVGVYDLVGGRLVLERRWREQHRWWLTTKVNCVVAAAATDNQLEQCARSKHIDLVVTGRSVHLDPLDFFEVDDSPRASREMWCNHKHIPDRRSVDDDRVIAGATVNFDRGCLQVLITV